MDALGSPDYVRYGERVFPARLLAASGASGEWRYAWRQQEHSPFTGAYSDAAPALQGSAGLNHATELRGRYVPPGTLVWMRLKGSVGQQQVYEFCDPAGGAGYGQGPGLPGGPSGTTQAITTSTTVQSQTVNSDTTLLVVTTTGPTPVEVTDFVLGPPAGQTPPPGVVYPPILPGHTFTITNTTDSSTDLVIVHDDPGADYPITTPSGQPLTVPPGTSVTLVADPTGTYWQVVTNAPPGPWSPTFSVTQNDLAVPPGLTALVPVLTAPVTLTGLDDLPVGQLFVIANPLTNSDDFTLSHLDASSSADNQFFFTTGSDVVLSPGESLTVMFDGDKVIDAGGSLSLSTSSSTPPSAYPGWVKVATVSYSAFSAASTSANAEAYPLPARAVIHGAVIKHTQSFTGGSISSYTLSLGYSSSPGEFTGALNVFAAPSDSGLARSSGRCFVESFGAATSIRLYATSNAFLNQATQGSVDVWLCLATLP